MTASAGSCIVPGRGAGQYSPFGVWLSITDMASEQIYWNLSVSRAPDLMTGSTENRFSTSSAGRLGSKDHVEIRQEPSLEISEEHPEPWVIYIRVDIQRIELTGLRGAPHRETQRVFVGKFDVLGKARIDRIKVRISAGVCRPHIVLRDIGDCVGKT